MTQQSRSWCFTINNWTEKDETAIAMAGARYTVYGKEVGESGTPHLQGYVYFANKKSMKGVSKLLPTAHLEMRKGTHEQARNYCIKDGDITEFGNPPEEWRRQCL